MKAIKKTGLVPVMVGKKIFGVRPADAIKGLANNEFVLADIPDGYETIDVAGYPAKEPEVEIVADSDGDGLVDIPDGWETMHHLKQIAIAIAILGLEKGDKLPVTDDQKPAAVAAEIIKAEIERRAAEA